MKCLSRSSNTLTMYSSLTQEHMKESWWFLSHQALWPLKVVKILTVRFRAEPTFRKAERFASSRPTLDKGPGDGTRNCGPRWAETPISLHFGASVTPIRPAGRKNPRPPFPPLTLELKGRVCWLVFIRGAGDGVGDKSLASRISGRLLNNSAAFISRISSHLKTTLSFSYLTCVGRRPCADRWTSPSPPLNT